ncbi:hypothetical protein EU546_08590 [Candidatus Thorarchaeota archaeon]|nr:MAG: hypothetical protein EU546_08590 [Candidatus Thorarchaeota archaeon]
MESAAISKEQILKSTLFHIQIKQCEYIDNFPEAVTSVFEKMIDENGIKDYKDMTRRLYRIDTNFFKINQDKVKKKGFFESLYERIARVTFR